MVVYCSISNYLIKKHPDFAQCFEDACITVDQYPLLVIPTKDEIKAIMDMQNTKSPEEFETAKKKLLSYLIHAKPKHDDSEFSSKPEGTNGLRQQVRFAKVTKDGFILHTGKKFNVAATCTFDKEFIPPNSSNRERAGQSVHKYVVKMEKGGDISVDGINKNEKVSEEVEKMYGGAYEGFKSADQDNSGKKATFEKMLRVWKTAIDSGNKKNPFVSAIAGLICWIKRGLEDKNSPNYTHYHRACQLVKSLGTYDAFGLYIVLIQPFGPYQFLPKILTSQEWDGAEKSADSGDEYCDLFESIDGMCGCDHCCKSSARDRGVEFVNEALGDKDKAVRIFEAYQTYIPEMFGDDFLDNTQKLWADELLFKLHKYFETKCCGSADDLKSAIDSMVEYAEQSSPGKNYASEALFAKSNYWKDVADMTSITSSTGSNSFVDSPFFLKCCFTSSTKCKSYVQGCNNPMSARARSYFMINGGSFYS